MARGRMVNKKISNSKRVNDLPLQAQLLFTWLIPHLDCNGCFYGSAQMIKSLVIPRKNWARNQIEKWLLIIESSRNDDGTPLICRYTVNSEQYLFMPGFVGEQIGLRYDKEKPEFPTFDGKNTEKIGQTTDIREEKRSRKEVEVKEEPYKENTKRKYGEFKNVLLTDEEYQKLKDKLGGAAGRFIENLSGYLESHKRKHYDSHYATILNWSRKEEKGGKARNPRALPESYTKSTNDDV